MSEGAKKWGNTAAVLEAKIVRVGASNHVVTAVEVDCPYCGGHHIHGWPISDPPTKKIERVCKAVKDKDLRYFVLG